MQIVTTVSLSIATAVGQSVGSSVASSMSHSLASSPMALISQVYVHVCIGLESDVKVTSSVQTYTKWHLFVSCFMYALGRPNVPAVCQYWEDAGC